MKILIVDLEPAPYKVDLWNEFEDQDECDIEVIFCKVKNWSKDGGHNYKELPEIKFRCTISRGVGIIDAINSLSLLFNSFIKKKHDIVYISGYVDFIPLIAIMLSVVFHKKYVLHSDVFNNDSTKGRFKYFKYAFRSFIREVLKKTNAFIFVCGKRGIESAVDSGFRKELIRDFPYVISKQRIMDDKPKMPLKECINDLQEKKNVILFSGRMIKRKGLDSLMETIYRLKDDNSMLWIEGDGLLYDYYKQKVYELDIEKKCRFLGFCQMSQHSWLIRNADIICVPSLQDPWGIVVDEGMQLGKVVIASNKTGSALDRIKSGHNGFIFNAGDSDDLAEKIKCVKNKPNIMKTIGNNAAIDSLQYSPKRNYHTLLGVLSY